jgi:phosphopantothenoylcysteine decarboxylase/phosphopantothenate--cysteine ligase
MAGDKSEVDKVNILLCVSGGIAAYKAVDLASKLTVGGAKVKTVMTANACRLIGPKSFEAVTGSAVFLDLWAPVEEYKVSHVALAKWADIVVAAPATADIIGKIANGICDELVSTTLCTSWAKPILLAPAMNSDMWNNPVVQRNVERIKEMGFRLIGPEVGRLACGPEGVGRMSEPKDIMEAIEKIASKIKRKKK